MTRKIIVALTFRDFKGTPNDQIQYMFLDSLKKQTFKDFTLAVTLFREQHVPDVITASGLPHVFYQDTPTDYKFSLSIMLLNAIDAGRKIYKDNFFVIWVNADNMLEPDFFERLSRCEGSKVGGVVYPHVEYSSIDDYKARRHGKYGWYGVDCSFFSSDVFTDDCISALKKYSMYDYLYFEFLMATVAIVFCDRRINLWPGGYSTVKNDYVAINQTREVVKASGRKNMVKLEGFCREFGLPVGRWYYLLWNYKILGNSVGARYMTTRIYLQELYAESYVRHAMPKLKRMLRLSRV